jgi:hypothetical protein
MALVYDGMSRAPLRAGLALIGSVDAVVLAVLVHQTAKSELSHRLAPRFLLVLHDQPLSLGVLVVVAMGGLFMFGTRRRPITGGLLAVGALAVLSESHAALVGGPARSFYVVGAVTLGWVFGLAYARGVSSGDPRHEAAGEEAFAEIGAVGAFAATYFGAGVSKLVFGGADWADTNHLRAIVVSQHPISDRSVLGTYASAVASHGTLSLAFGLVALVVQLGAVALLVSPFMRKLWTAVILAFHLNTLLLLHIIYLEAVVIAVLFGYPWPAILARLRGRPVRAPSELSLVPVASPRATSNTLAAALAVLAGLAVIGSIGPVRRYTGEHHRGGSPLHDERVSEVDTPPGAEVRRLLGGLTPGDSLAGFRVAAVRGPSKGPRGEVQIELREQEGAGDAGLVIIVTALGARPYPAPRSSELYSLFYREGDLGAPPPTSERRDAALDSVLSRITTAERNVPMPEGM